MSAPALRLLGPPCLHLPGRPAVALGSRRLHQLLVFLGWQGSRGCSDDQGWVARDELAEMFWPDSRQAQARTNLRKLLLELRQTGLAALLEEDPGRLRWQPGSDVDVFASACDSACWLHAAEAGGALPMAGLEAVPPGQAWLDWLQDQRRQHHLAWRAAVAQALPLAAPKQAAQLAERLLQVDPHDAAGRAYMRGQGALPLAAWAPLAPLVGRETELAALLAMLQRSRLVTVHGPGGVGKSRLARHAADTLADRFAQGVALVMLDDLSTPGAVPARVADTLGLVLPPHADPALALSLLLAARSMLLVLDGFEAVVDASALVPRLLAAAPGLRLLITSRERMDVDGECLLPLDSLAVPTLAADGALALCSPAVRLFIDRACAVQPDFDADAAWPAMAEICRRVGGLPLAIEWAAAWMRVMPAADLAREIAADIALGGEDGPVAVFESSWRLLTHQEREAYAALAVFRGGFSRAAAQQVAGVGLHQLASLIDKSMLRTGTAGRLGMHPLVHAHARSKLDRLPGVAALLAQHASWYLALLQRSHPLPDAENENVLVAWQHAVEQRDAAAVEAALGHIQWSVLVVGRRSEAAALVRDAAARFGVNTPTGAYLQAHRAWILLWLDSDAQACDLARQAMPTLQAAGHAAGLAMCLRTLGHAARRVCEPALAAQYFEQALDLPDGPGGLDLRAALHDALGMALLQDGRIESAQEQFQVALALNLAGGDEVQRMYNLYNLARAHAAAGRPALALLSIEAALAVGQTCRFPLFLPYLHAEVARAQVTLGQPGQARAHVELALAGAHDTGDSTALAGALEARARLAWLRGDGAAARQDLAHAARCALRTGHLALGPLLLPAAQQAYGGTAFAARWSLLPAAQLLATLADDMNRVDPVPQS